MIDNLFVGLKNVYLSKFGASGLAMGKNEPSFCSCANGQCPQSLRRLKKSVVYDFCGCVVQSERCVKSPTDRLVTSRTRVKIILCCPPENLREFHFFNGFKIIIMIFDWESLKHRLFFLPSKNVMFKKKKKRTRD